MSPCIYAPCRVRVAYGLRFAGILEIKVELRLVRRCVSYLIIAEEFVSHLRREGCVLHEIWSIAAWVQQAESYHLICVHLRKIDIQLLPFCKRLVSHADI